MNTEQALLSSASNLRWSMYQLNVNLFTQRAGGKIFVDPPLEFGAELRRLAYLNKSMYGLVQSPQTRMAKVRPLFCFSMLKIGKTLNMQLKELKILRLSILCIISLRGNIRDQQAS